jgi:hypothetical protein
MLQFRSFFIALGVVGLATMGVSRLAAQDSKVDTNTGAIKRLTDEFLNQGRADVVAALYTIDGIHHTPLGDLDIKGRQGTRAALGMAIPDFKVKIVSLTANDNWVSVLYEFSGSFTGKLPTPDGAMVPGNNALILMPLGTFYRFNEQGKIAESWELYDNLNFSMTLGLLPAPKK